MTCLFAPSLGVASHIDNYQPPEQSASVQHK
ncbi:TPA: division septum protein Blr [Escherichia coli]